MYIHIYTLWDVTSYFYAFLLVAFSSLLIHFHKLIHKNTSQVYMVLLLPIEWFFVLVNIVTNSKFEKQKWNTNGLK